MINKLFFCLILFTLLISAADIANAGTMKSNVGVIIESGDFITIQISYEEERYLKFSANVPKYEMTTGLSFAGDITKGQTVRLVYKDGLEDGLVQAEYLLFNPRGHLAADIETYLLYDDNDVYLSDDGRYRLYADFDTVIMDSQGRKADLRVGQYILGWFREAVYNESAVLSKAVILNTENEAQPYKQIKITDSGEVLLDDGPIAKLDELQAEFCRQHHMAPVRPIAEALGYTVEWEPDHTVCLTNGEYSFDFNINDEYYQLNDKFVYFSGKRFVLFRDHIFADYTVINALVNNCGPLNSIIAGRIIRKGLENT